MTAPTDAPTIAPERLIISAVAAEVEIFLGGASQTDNQVVAWHATSVVFGLMNGELRGRVPMPIPPTELQAVLRAASIRYAAMIARLTREHDSDLMTSGEAPAPQQGTPGLVFTGFTFPELLVLHRYRQRTA